MALFLEAKRVRVQLRFNFSLCMVVIHWCRLLDLKISEATYRLLHISHLNIIF